MQGGGHHEPSVLTHFLPGMVSGIVLGGITGALIITHIASTSLQFFWEASRVKEYGPVETCADPSGVQITSSSSENGISLTSVTIGGAQETLLTVPQERLRLVTIADEAAAYLTAVASTNQQSAFPAASLYRIDYCAKTLTHILGSADELTNILGVSPSGTWVLYGKEKLLLMNTKEHSVLPLAAYGEVIDVVFSQADDGGAILLADGSGVVWSLSENGSTVLEDAFITAVSLPAWIFESPEEYFANIK